MQEAIYARLDHADVTGLLTTKFAPLPGIFSRVPQVPDSGADDYFPYITIGRDVTGDFSTKDTMGGSALVQIDIWSRAIREDELKDIADAVDARLRRQTLAIAGTTHITTELETTQMMDDPDGITRRIMSQYRVIYLG